MPSANDSVLVESRKGRSGSVQTQLTCQTFGNPPEKRGGHRAEFCRIRRFDGGDFRRADHRRYRQTGRRKIVHRYVAGPSPVLRAGDYHRPQQPVSVFEATGGYHQRRPGLPGRAVGVRKAS